MSSETVRAISRDTDMVKASIGRSHGWQYWAVTARRSRGGGVGTSAMPKGADEEDAGAGGHYDRYCVIVRGRTTLAPAVAAGYDDRRAIVGGEVVDRPDRRRRQRCPWTRNRVEAVVMMRQLRGLSGLNVDGLQCRKQVVRHQQPIEHRQHPGIVDEPVAHSRPAQHAVDALGAPALERVASAVPQPGAHDLTDLPAFLSTEQVLPNDVPVAVEGS